MNAIDQAALEEMSLRTASGYTRCWGQNVPHIIVDGMILTVSNPGTSLALRRLADTGLPYVLAYNRHAEHPCVSVDGEQAVAELVVRLASLGHRRIAMVTGQLHASDRAQQRCRGFQRGMAQAGLGDGTSATVLEVPFVDTAIQSICGPPGAWVSMVWAWTPRWTF